MSSTTGIQNLLVNVFRPVYSYEIPVGGSTQVFVPKLEMSNIDTYSGNTVSVFTAAIGDSNSNVYVGSNAGNPFTTTKLCRNVTAVGFSAGSNISNVSNSTYVGFNAGAGAVNASNVVAIGANAIGDGTFNVYIGTGTGSTGSSNIYIGTSNTGLGSGNILIGQNISNGSSNDTFRLGPNFLYGNLSTNWLGIGTPSPNDANNRVDVSGNLYVLGQVGVNRVPVRTVDINGNFRASDASGTIDFNQGDLQSTGGYYSTRGTTNIPSGTTTIGVLKKGIINLSCVDIASTANRSAYIVFASDETGVTIPDVLISNSAGDLDFAVSGPDIQISNAGLSPLDVAWSITYFPLP
jgi:hypothetical protein